MKKILAELEKVSKSIEAGDVSDIDKYLGDIEKVVASLRKSSSKGELFSARVTDEWKDASKKLKKSMADIDKKVKGIGKKRLKVDV